MKQEKLNKVKMKNINPSNQQGQQKLSNNLNKEVMMKKLFIIALAVLMTAGIASLALANGSGLGIVGSPHDFSDDVVAGVATPGFEVGGGWNKREEICRVCHVPHDHGRSTQYYLNGLLWNHAVSSATYTMYDDVWSSTLDGAQSGQPDGIAKLCLGCHDGTVGVDVYDKYAGGSVFMSDYDGDFMIPGFSNDLTGTHPLSITYDNVADPGLKNPATTAMGLSGVINDVLDNGKVQCSSCHDVHDQEAVAGTHLLRVANNLSTGTASGLCLTCHIK